MQALEILKSFKKKIDPVMAKYLDEVVREARKNDVFSASILEYVKKTLLNGGKRLRPAFMYYSYLGAGGKDKEEMLKASMSIELIHAFLLIHDDIIDKDDIRHGMDTINFRYKKIGKRFMKNSECGHFGDSMALLVGDMVGALGNQVLYSSNFRPDRIIMGLNKLQSIVANTVIGETKDVLMQYRKNVKEKDVMEMYEYKTAKYTIEGPLHLGGILAGADDKLLSAFSKYAIPVGIAFQIQDDILGLFGSEKKIGKPVGSDIAEGKKTLLVVKALELGNQKQKNIIQKYLGKSDVTKQEIEEFRQAVTECGSLKYCQDMACSMVQKGRKAIQNEKMEKEAKEFFLGIADYMVKREV